MRGAEQVAAPPLAVSVADGARLSGLGVTTMWKLVHTKQVGSVRIGRRVLIPRSEIERLVHVDNRQGAGLT